MSNGGFGRGLLATMAVTLAGAGAIAAAGFGAATPDRRFALVDSGPRRNAHHSDRTGIYLGRWSYARKGKRTAAQIQRAARKKRNRKRNK